jgi:hypothetical protein
MDQEIVEKYNKRGTYQYFKSIKFIGYQAWWHMPVIPVFRKLRQEDHEFGITQVYIASSRQAWANFQDSVSKK